MAVSTAAIQVPAAQAAPAHRGRVVAVANWKGGTGKTSTVANLGYALAQRGHRVLVVDLDPQANLTPKLSGEGADSTSTVADLLLAGLGERPAQPDAALAVRPTPYPGLFLLPAPPKSRTSPLATAEAAIQIGDQVRPLRRLQRACEQLRDQYDWVLIDAPPAVGILTLNALVAADELIVAIKPEVDAVEGYETLSWLVADIREEINPGLRVLGAVVIGDTRHRETRDTIAELAAAGAPTIGPVVPISVARAAQAQRRRAPLSALWPDHSVARAYDAIAAELDKEVRP